MNKVKSLTLAIALISSAVTNAEPVHSDSLITQSLTITDDLMSPVQPTYLDGIVTTDGSGWLSNWFINAQASASVFAGHPLGCADMFDRMTASWQFSLGKWITPSVGLRAVYHTGNYKDCTLTTRSYDAFHADVLYNLASGFHAHRESLPRWTVSPYFGLGIAMKNHFTLNYGAHIGYRVADRLNITAELGAMTTFQSFDGCGSATRLGDHMVSMSLGLSYCIGKTGWKRVVDVQPYMIDNELLRARINDLLGSKLSEAKDDSGQSDTETYSGLASLRARLANTKWNGNSASSDTVNHVSVGVPVFFFFHINTANLINNSQLVNLDEIAQLVKEKNLKVYITGAADSATGDKQINSELAKRRTKRIAKELLNRGVPLASMHGYSLGGIDTYQPNQANRFTKVVLLEQ